MAKRRGFFKRARVSRRSAKSYRRGVSSRPEAVIIPAMAYGALRAKLSQLITPVTSAVPLGGYADEVVLGTIGWFAAKKGRGMIKEAGKAMLTVEAFSLGNQVVGNFLAPQASNNSGAYYVGVQ